MACLTITDARDIASRGRPWSIRLEYTGSNYDNKSGWSSKFWFATGRGLHEPVEIGWGKNGNKPQTQVTDFPTVEDRVSKKLAKGYDYTDAPYRRMSQAGLAKIGAWVTTTPTAAPAPKPAPKPTPTPAPATPAPIAPTPKVSTHTVSAAQDALGEPWSLIHSLRIKRNGTKVIGYDALDDGGDFLLTMTATSGLDFARDYDVDVEFA